MEGLLVKYDHLNGSTNLSSKEKHANIQKKNNNFLAIKEIYTNRSEYHTTFFPD